MGIPLTSTLSNLYLNGRWLLPSARTDNQVTLHAYLTNISLTAQDDYYEWEIDGKIENRYNTGTVYTLLREQLPLVNWSRAVWIKGGVPRQSFLCWLFVLNRCPTKDRILGWGLQTDPKCLLCANLPESRDHLLFVCGFSWSIWSRVASRSQKIAHRDWASTISTMQSLRGPRENTRLSLLAWQTTIYNIWTERNQRLHRNTFRSVDTILQIIDSTIRNRISGFRDTNPNLRSGMMQRWLRNH
ncbi:unnamed protein product [Arabis nemorensis]|uniref:Reverse transcriptase zinc-binding domain-containing protein n=1 Tax=Arabis nemorensis TaxID=586526 RepID=A0A565CDJ5_9BRAS|nr:unnamed protein product [Arabis nemorensis]